MHADRSAIRRRALEPPMSAELMTLFAAVGAVGVMLAVLVPLIAHGVAQRHTATA